MLSFYLKDKRIEGPGHPPVYIPESQDIQNEFSFWPRYDEFVEADPSLDARYHLYRGSRNQSVYGSDGPLYDRSARTESAAKSAERVHPMGTCGCLRTEPQ